MSIIALPNDSEDQTAGWLTLGGILLVCLVITLGVIKVRNELLMTKAYDRQAVALERIADVLDGKKAVP